MKQILSLAVLALIGNVSASKLTTNKLKHDKIFQEFHVDDLGFVVLGDKTILRRQTEFAQIKGKKESDWLGNGDAADDKECESELGDEEDEVVNDSGFGLAAGVWLENPHKANQYAFDLAYVNTKAKTGMGLWIREGRRMVHKSFRESDHLANGDHKDDLEVESELGDAEDEIVTDNGFALGSGNWANNAHKANQYAGSLRFAQKRSRKYSDTIANGDADDDKEVEDHMDPDDTIINDHGFRATINWHRPPALMQKRRKHKHRRHSDEVVNGDPTDDKEVEDLKDTADDIVTDHGFRATVNWGKSLAQRKRHSDDVVNGDHTDDKEVEDLKDTADDIVTDHGFRATVNWPKPPSAALVNLGKESDWIANADAADDKEVESEQGDAEDEIVNDSGFALAGGIWADNSVKADQYNGDLNFVQLDYQKEKSRKGNGHKVKKGSKSQKKSKKAKTKKLKKKTHKKSKTNVQLRRFSDELANGDASDDKELHEADDPNDAIVDYNGHSKEGYGSKNPPDFRKDNTINSAVGPGHFITVPRADVQLKEDVNVKKPSYTIFDDLDMQMEEMDMSFDKRKHHKKSHKKHNKQQK